MLVGLVSPAGPNADCPARVAFAKLFASPSAGVAHLQLVHDALQDWDHVGSVVGAVGVLVG